MPLLLPFRRAGPHERVLQAFLFSGCALLAGLVLVPLALMVALSFGDPTDWFAGRRWPDLSYLLTSRRLYVYYLTVRYDYWAAITGFNELYGTEGETEPTILNMKEAPALAGDWRRRAQDALACLKERMPWTHTQMLFTGWGYFRVEVPITAYTGLGEEAWKKYLKRKYRTIESVNRQFQTEYPTFAHVQPPELPNPNLREGYPLDNPWVAEYRLFLETSAPAAWRLARPGTRYWRAYLESLPEIGKDLAKLNSQLSPAIAGPDDADASFGGAPHRSVASVPPSGTSATPSDLASWKELRLTESMPPSAGMRRLWEKYVRETLNAHYVRIEPGDDPKAGTRLETKFRKFLLARHGSEDRVAAMYLAPSRALRLPLTVGGLRSSTAFNDWDAFVRTIPLESLRIDSSEAIWQRWLKERYGSLESLNAAHGTRCASFGEIPWPQPEIDRLDWERNRPAYLAEILLKNYRRAWSFIAVASPSLWNTLRFAILFTLLSIAVNTAAGYALSRFGSGPGQLALAGLLALAAFPIEAIAVPNFVLLRDMGLLNTVWALVLPAAVNGYYIYLMKGFFDAIPRQCFEDAELEGASEWRMLWLVALPLARPMAAVIALYAFLWSYSNFMWALIVCQQRAQWTLPVFIFNVNSWGATAPLLGAIMVLTTVPPLLMFVFAHRVLQRSLALPRTYV